MQIPFVGFQAIQSSEHMAVCFFDRLCFFAAVHCSASVVLYCPLPARSCSSYELYITITLVLFCGCAQALGVFGLCQLYSFVSYVRSRLSAAQFSLVLRFLATVVGGSAVLAFVVLTATGSAPSFRIASFRSLCSVHASIPKSRSDALRLRVYL